MNFCEICAKKSAAATILTKIVKFLEIGAVQNNAQLVDLEILPSEKEKETKLKNVYLLAKIGGDKADNEPDVEI